MQQDARDRRARGDLSPALAIEFDLGEFGHRDDCEGGLSGVNRYLAGWPVMLNQRGTQSFATTVGQAWMLRVVQSER
jgi:hypothetical protein